MPNSLHLDPALSIIKEFEGLRLMAYQDSVGIWTIGYGTTAYPSGARVNKGETCTPEQANLWLDWHINHVVLPVLTKSLKVQCTNNETCALISLTYNIGTAAFAKSTLLKLLNANKPRPQVAAQFARWNKADGVELPGLTRRRAAEAELFLRPDALSHGKLVP